MTSPTPPPGHRELEVLIASMQPVLHPGRFVFATLAGGDVPPGVAPVMTFREAEGLTLILDAEAAREHGIAGVFPCRMITLSVHSSLEAVGFLARVTARLAREGMGVNPVSAYFHDHLFVPEDRAADALAVLRSMAREAGGHASGQMR